MQIIDEIQNSIHTIRGIQVMLDEDLARLYKVETGALNRAVKRNNERFPEEFRFQLTEIELKNLKCQFGISSGEILRCQNGTLYNSDQNLESQTVTPSLEHGGRRKLPYAFTEQGVTMLSAILRSDVAVKRSIQIINAFVGMRKFIASNASIFDRVASVELKQLKHESESDKKFSKLFTALESGELKPKQGIFYDGHIFDAHVFVSKVIKRANKSIVLVDNFVDENVLQLLTKRKKSVSVTIYTKTISESLKQDLVKYNAQYKNKEQEIKIKSFKKAHDRFLVIDERVVYHLGASLKDLGKKWFAFSKFEKDSFEILTRLKHKITK